MSSAEELKVEQIQVQSAMTPASAGEPPAAAAAAAADDDDEEEFGIDVLKQRVHMQKGTKTKKASAAVETLTEAEFAEEAKKIFKADIFAFSAAQDNQTAADVQNVAQFGLPRVDKDDPKSAAGGACTNAIQQILKKRAALAGSRLGKLTDELTFGSLLIEMRHVLKDMNYTQNPSLTSSRSVDLTKRKFTLINPKEKKALEAFSKGEAPRKPRRRALVIGINYVDGDPEAVLAGCVNDAKAAMGWIKDEGFDTSNTEDVHFLTDDKSWTMGQPTGEGIMQHMQWLVKDAIPGDSLFFHFSGHGIQERDYSGQEEDGYNENLAATDWQGKGLIQDDTISKIFMLLGEGVHATLFFDCCHSQTLFESSFVFEANDANVEALAKGKFTRMLANGAFKYDKAKAWTKEVASGAWDASKELGEKLKKYMEEKRKEGCCWCC